MLAMPRSFFLIPVVFLGAIYFFFEGDGEALLPVRYVYLLFSIFIVFFLFCLLRSRVSKKFLFFLVLLMLSASISTFFSGVPSAFLYSVSPLFVILLADDFGVSKSHRQSELYASFLLVPLLIIGIIVLPTFEQNYHGRGFLPWVGNPNYTSMLYLGLFLSSIVLLDYFEGCCKKILSYLSVFLIFVVLYITETRSIFLAVAVFYIMQCFLKLKWYFILRSSAIGVVVASVVGQLIFYYVFLSVDNIASDRLGGFSIFDESNRQRVTAFYTTLMITLDDSVYLYTGLGDVADIWENLDAAIDNVPHNWFMMMVLSNGYFFSLVVLFVYLYGVMSMRRKYLPAFCSILIAAFIIGRAALFAPLGLLLVAIFVTNINDSRSWGQR